MVKMIAAQLFWALAHFTISTTSQDKLYRITISPICERRLACGGFPFSGAWFKMAGNLLLRSSSLMLVCVSLLIAGCRGNAPAEKARELPRVTVGHPVVRNLVDEADYNGWLSAYKSVDVRARVKGHITKVYFKDGDMVEENKTPLFDIDQAPVEADLAKTEAQIKVLEAQQVAAKKIFERNQVLIRTNAVSQQELEESEANVKSYTAQILAKTAEAKRIGLDLNYCKIVASLTGKVGRANLIAGDLVNAGGTDPVLTTIVSVNSVYVDFNVDERAAQRYRTADLERADKEKDKDIRDRNIKFTFGLDTDKGYPHEGKIVYRDLKFGEGTGTILVRGLADDKDGIFLPGSRVRVRLPVSDAYDATLVPDIAVNTEQKQKYLLVVGEDKNVKRVNVELGRLLDDGMRVVLAPKLNVDTKVIIEGMERARLNYPVEPIAESAAEGTAAAK